MISQLQVLNKILETKDFSIVTMNNLTEDYFFNYKAEFNFIKNHYEQYHNIPDTLTFQGSFPDFDVELVTESDNYLLTELYNDYNTSYLITKFNGIKGLIEKGDTDAAMDFFTKAISGLRQGGAVSCTNLITDTSRFDRYLERMTNGNGYISTGLPELDAIIGGIDKENENMVIAARTGIGKCLAKGTKVLMADGTTKAVEEVTIGDAVQSYNRVNKVLALHNGVSNGYKIVPTKGEPFTVSANHILTLYKYNEVYDKSKHKMVIKGGSVVDIMVEDFLQLSAHQKHLYKLMRPAVSYETKEQLIPPYILGLWLGDGTSKYAQICTADNEIVSELTKYCDESNQELHLLQSQDKSHGKAHVYSICGKLQSLLHGYNLLNNKHIPLNYLTGDEQQRLQLLAGLLDTDGCLLSSGMFDFTQKNKDLFDQVAQLARGLGFKVCIQKAKFIKDNYYHRLTISGDLSRIPTCIARKQSPKKQKIISTNVGFSIIPVDYVEYYGFMCDGDHRYLLADNTLTHNTWLLILMAVAAVKQGLNVGFYSGEMSKDKVGYRMDTLLGNIKNSAITRGEPNDYVEREYKRYIDNLPTSTTGQFNVFTPNDIAGPATVPALQALVEKYKFDILFIDQYSLLEDTSRSTVMHERVANIAKAIKNLQVMKQIPIISVTQMNRTKAEDEKGNKIQDPTQIALSDRIGQDATVILMLSRLEDDGEDDQRLKIEIAKSRDGGDGRHLIYNVDFNTGKFDAVTEGADEKQAKEIEDSYEPF